MQKPAKLKKTTTFGDETVAFISEVLDERGITKKKFRMAVMKDGRVFLRDYDDEFDFVLLRPEQIEHLEKVLEIAKDCLLSGKTYRLW